MRLSHCVLGSLKVTFLQLSHITKIFVQEQIYFKGSNKVQVVRAAICMAINYSIHPSHFSRTVAFTGGFGCSRFRVQLGCIQGGRVQVFTQRIKRLSVHYWAVGMKAIQLVLALFGRCGLRWSRFCWGFWLRFGLLFLLGLNSRISVLAFFFFFFYHLFSISAVISTNSVHAEKRKLWFKWKLSFWQKNLLNKSMHFRTNESRLKCHQWFETKSFTKKQWHKYANSTKRCLRHRLCGSHLLFSSDIPLLQDLSCTACGVNQTMMTKVHADTWQIENLVIPSEHMNASRRCLDTAN